MTQLAIGGNDFEGELGGVVRTRDGPRQNCFICCGHLAIISLPELDLSSELPQPDKEVVQV